MQAYIYHIILAAFLASEYLSYQSIRFESWQKDMKGLLLPVYDTWIMLHVSSREITHVVMARSTASAVK